MKKSLILGILGLTAGAVSSFGQGFIVLDNYNTGGPNVSFGAGSGGSGALTSAYTVGLYFAAGSVAADSSSGSGSVSPLLALGSGSGSTAQFDSAATGSTPGEFLSNFSFNTGTAAGSTVTVELVAYLTSAGSYANSSIRGHSADFDLVTAPITQQTATQVGTAMSAFSVLPVTPVPEPTTLALAGLGGLASLVAFRRKKA
jgi:hypothetical protein